MKLVAKARILCTLYTPNRHDISEIRKSNYQSPMHSICRNLWKQKHCLFDATVCYQQKRLELISSIF